MPFIIIICNLIACSLWLFQIIFAFLYHLRTDIRSRDEIDHVPNLSVVVPAYNETDHTIQKVVDSILLQRNVNVEVFVVDDGSINPLSIEKHSKVVSLRLPENKGKRYAQICAMNRARYEWIVTVDSDTILKPNALFELYKTAILHNLDAATGTVLLHNGNQNLLTRMTACLYWYGFFQERAAQSYFGQVTCCAGALSVYRKKILLDNAETYLNQTFLGSECRAGDDRFLTCLFAINGKRIGCSPFAHAYTISPANTCDFLKQQIRWSRSHTPALFFILGNFRKCSKLFIFFMLRITFRYGYFMLLYAFIISQFICANYLMLFLVLLSVLVISGIKALIAWGYTRNLRFVGLLPFSIITFFLITPLVIYGALTPTKTAWLTRTKRGIHGKS